MSDPLYGFKPGERVSLVLREPGHRNTYRVFGEVEEPGIVGGIVVVFDQPFCETTYERAHRAVEAWSTSGLSLGRKDHDV